MNHQNYRCIITAAITPDEAISCIDRVSQWWTGNFEGSSERLNDVFTVRFGETSVTFKVIEVTGLQKRAWQVTDCYLHWLKDQSEWNNTTLCWELAPVGQLTQVTFTHIGLVAGIECYNDCVKGWDFYIAVSLFKLITEGKGMPETPKAIRE
jgi:hypothetical protein